MKIPFDSFILLMQGYPPYMGKKNVYYQDKMFTSRMAEKPAFTTREEAVKLARGTIEKYKRRQWFTVDAEEGSRDVPDVPEDARDIADGAPVDIPDDVPETWPDDLPEGLPEDEPEDLEDYVTDDIPEDADEENTVTAVTKEIGL